MKQFKLLALVPAMFLAACGGDEQSVEEKAAPGSVTYSYPADGQADVSPKTDIILRFSHPVTDNSLNENINLKANGDSISFNVEKVDGGKSLKLTTPGTLMNGVEYSITFEDPLQAEGGRIIETPNSVGKPGIQFHTRGSFSGVASEANTQNDFKIAWSAPSLNKQGAEYFETMDFSTFRIAMTQPIHPEWKKLGGSIELRDKNGDLVPATILVKGNRISVDPCVADRCGSKEDILKAGETYTLELSNLASLNKDTEDLSERFKGTFPVMPKDTGSTVVLQQSAADSNQGRITSILNGQAINSVTLNSVLQGKAGPSQQGGDLFAELAPNSPDMDTDDVLLRIPKGSVLESTSLNVKVGGKVQVLDAATGDKQETGTIKVTMLSDATGYMRSNPYTDELDAPRHLTLFMDASMNTEEAQPNAALSQDLMSIQLRGTAEVMDGVLTIDAIGMVEPALLGQEFTDSTIAFHLKADTDVNSALDAEDIWKREQEDTTPPELVSWMPGDKENAIPNTRQSMQRPGDPVILFFDEPLDPDSIADGVKLYADGSELTVGNGLNAKLDGTALTLNPEGGLKPGVQYRVSAASLTDLAGNSYANMGDDLSFSLDGERDALADAPPLALTTYPGFPCETNHDQLDFDKNILGECYTKGANSINADDDTTTGGDLLPVSEMPEDRPITVVFSQPMKLDSIRLGETFKVNKVDAKGEDIDEGQVTGRLEKNYQRIRFYPDDGWEPGEFYQYTLVSLRDTDNTDQGYTAHCTGPKPDSVCGINDYPLKADLLEGLNSGLGNGADPDPQSLKIYFKGAPAQDSVFTPLRNLPIRDMNANLKIDDNEPFAHESDGNGSYLPSANSAKLVVNYKDGEKQEARVGCAVDSSTEKEVEQCKRNKFIYQAYALNTEVIGTTILEDGPDKGKPALEVLLYPTTIATTSLDVHLSLFSIVSTTGPQVLRMRYAKNPDCADSGTDCPRDSLIPGYIVEDESGQSVFKTKVDVFLDAPELRLESILTAEHNLFNYEFTLDLVGDVTFFDDGRMQIEQYNLNIPPINVQSEVLSGLVKKEIPLVIPKRGLYLNFISNPVKDLPAQYQEQVAQ
ncbi:Ig-like domain-containing protein [Marinobacter piscensis]|uniref:Ig-like domain-containing protein n=1 Tax=Marinobacter piscensis TaxID=1562308 RepID=UPI0011A14478|nr:Ig-like domain-containing protein [Marinobacter piscensis]